MNARKVIRSALASAATLGLVSAAADAVAQPKPKEACFGVAKRGLNDCGNLSGTHSCAGQSREDFDPFEWRYVPAGTCKALKGMLRSEAIAAYRERYPDRPPPALDDLGMDTGETPRKP